MQPTPLTPEIRAELVSALVLGLPLRHAAGLVGTHPLTVRAWLRDDPDLLREVTAKIETRKGEMLGRIQAAAAGGNAKAARALQRLRRKGMHHESMECET